MHELRENPNARLIAASRQIADMTRREYPEFRDRILDPDFEAFQTIDRSIEFVVDNAELLLASVLHRMPTIITMSENEGI